MACIEFIDGGSGYLKRRFEAGGVVEKKPLRIMDDAHMIIDFVGE